MEIDNYNEKITAKGSSSQQPKPLTNSNSRAGSELNVAVPEKGHDTKMKCFMWHYYNFSITTRFSANKILSV